MLKPFLPLVMLSFQFLAAESLSATEIIAHRGFSMRAPENTVESLNLAWQHKADSCEIDIRLTADGQIVLMHDADTKRTGGKPGLVIAESKAEDLFKLDVGSWKGESWKGVKVPTLAQALATIPEGNHRLVIEVKSGPEIIPALTKELEGMKDRAKQLVVISFNRDVVAAAKKAIPWVKVHRLSSTKDKDKNPVDLAKLIADTKADGLDGLSLSKDWPWSAEMAKQIRDAGLEMFVWTINDLELAAQLAKLGFDGITSDDPVMLREALKK